MLVLISPNSYAEAALAVSGGADIVDVKNVAEGSLGAQEPRHTKRIVSLIHRAGLPASVTLGDLGFQPGTAGLAAAGAALLGADYIKAGLYGVSNYEQAHVMMRVIRESAGMVDAKAGIVAAGYADYRNIGGIPPQELVRAAARTACRAVMLDTAVKDGKTLFDCLTCDELTDFVEAARSAGLLVGLAGSIRLEHIDSLGELRPDLIGVRGAVCEETNRACALSLEKTRQFVQAIRELGGIQAWSTNKSQCRT